MIQGANLVLKALNIKKRYRTNESDIVNDFYVPCLSQSKYYQRAVGYFTSGGLIYISKGLKYFLENRGRMQLIASPYLNELDVKAINEGYKKREQVILQSLINELDQIDKAPLSDEIRVNLSCLSSLIASGHLEIKLALPIDQHNDYKHGIYHEKLGIFSDLQGNKVAFHGSLNETVGGLVDNFESIMVFKSWNDPESRVPDLQNDFDQLWLDTTEKIKVIPFPDAAKEKLIRFQRYGERVKTISISGIKETQKLFESSTKWRHQDEAVEVFLSRKRGILEMATGTGKTRTALKILSYLITNDEINTAIVTTDGNDLLEQWADEIYRSRFPCRVLKHFGIYHDLMEFTYDPYKSILIISRQQLHRVLGRINDNIKKKMIIIHDEVHGLGSQSNVNKLRNKLGPTPYRLGLSATPEREYDEEGTKFIIEHIGDVIYRFELEDAIRRGILCEFNYYPLEFHITPKDKQKLHSIYRQKAARKEAGNPMSEEEIWMAIARIYKTSEAKLPVVDNFLKEHPHLLKRSIIFVEDKEYGEKVLRLVHKYRYDFHTYYAEDDRQNLLKFAKGDINCLVTCHKLSQGIDIQSLESVILFSSNRSRLETIQRMGRCLRMDPKNPNKKANIIDCIRIPEDDGDIEDLNGDQERRLWLQELSSIKREV
jgi:superfamily II DNA or RNA helicase